MATSQMKTPLPAVNALSAENETLRKRVAELEAQAPKSGLCLPFKPMPADYDERIMNIESMTIRLNQKHRLKLRAIIDGLFAQHAQLENGDHVENQTHALRWLLENISLNG